jgi:hypothetical protein
MSLTLGGIKKLYDSNEEGIKEMEEPIILQITEFLLSQGKLRQINLSDGYFSVYTIIVLN